MLNSQPQAIKPLLDSSSVQAAPFSDVAAYLAANVYGKPKGEQVPYALFKIGRLHAESVAKLSKFRTGFGSQPWVYVSGKSLKHTDEGHHDHLVSVAPKLNNIIEGRARFAINPSRADSALLIYPIDNKSSSLIVIELNQEHGRTMLVNLFKGNRRYGESLLRKGELDSVGLVGRQSEFSRNSPHSYVADATRAGDEFSAVQADREEILLELDDGRNIVLTMLDVTLDDAGAGLSALARAKWLRALAMAATDYKTATSPLAKAKALKARNEARLALGLGRAAPAVAQESAPEVREPRKATSQFYEFDPNRKHAQRKKDNAEAMALLRKIDAGELAPERLTDADKAALAKYSGLGGALTGADGKTGSAYEYYTPKPIAEGIWAMLGELGFSGGKVLDPCAGVGIFGATAPLSVAVDAVELNETSGRINGLVNAGPGYTATVSPFEKVADATPDEQYDAVAVGCALTRSHL